MATSPASVRPIDYTGSGLDPKLASAGNPYVQGAIVGNGASSTTGGSKAPLNNYAVVTSKPATQDFNNIQTDYNTNIKPNMQNAAANAAATTQADKSLPVISGYNVSANQTGNEGEQKATNQQTGSSYFITPQEKAGNSTDALKSILSAPDTSSSVPIATPQQEATHQTGIDPNVDSKEYQSQLLQGQDELTQGYNQFKETINQIMSGAFPLSAPQQALVDATNSAFQQMTTQANLKAAALSSQTGGVSNKVTAAAGELTNITAAQAATVAKLEIGFQDQNYKAVTESYAAFKDLEASKMSTIEKLHNSIMDTYNKALTAAQKVTDNINAVAMDAAKNGADQQTLANIRASGDEASAIASAGSFLQSGTGTLGDYLQYKRDAESKGLVPTDYQSYKDTQEAKDSQKRINEAVAINKAKQISDEAFTASDKNQQKLEQQYRGVLAKENSSRSGSIGVESAKVNQANHLNSLITQYYDPQTGNYNVPTAQYAELVLGLASLVANNGNTSEGERASIEAKSAVSDVNGLAQYLSGVPKNGNTQDMIKNMVDSIDRQAETAISNREAALQTLRYQAPTDLEQSRVDALNKSTNMVEYAGQERIDKKGVETYIASPKAKTPVTPELNTKISSLTGGKTFNTSGELAIYMSSLPGATPTSVLNVLNSLGFQ